MVPFALSLIGQSRCTMNQFLVYNILVDLPRKKNTKIWPPVKCHTGPYTETPV